MGKSKKSSTSNSKYVAIRVSDTWFVIPARFKDTFENALVHFEEFEFYECLKFCYYMNEEKNG